MSTAKPMAIGRRIVCYAGDGFRLTGPQRKRHRHKYQRMYGQQLYGAKGKPQATPRQRRAAP